MALVEGGNGADTLDGTAGNDTVKGLNGNDTLNGLAGLDILEGGSGNDLMDGGDDDDLLLGGIGLDTLVGRLGNDRLDGGAGIDSMAGGAGDDTYVVDSASDSITELAGEGIDLVEASVSYTLSAELENLTLTGTGAINGTGNGLNNILTGNGSVNRLFGLGGNDTLDGGFGADQMAGGIGDDYYVVDNKADKITELAGEGTDEVHAFVTYTLSANIESLFLDGGSVISGTGNAQDNTITGNAQANTLDGGLGADTLFGGGGNDTYVVDDIGDTVTDASGTDNVRSSISFDLSTNTVNVENLTLTGTAAINGIGDSGDNIITGNTAANTLTGGLGNDALNGLAGADVMIGGDDDDTYYIDNAGDVVSEVAGEGTDSIFSSISFDLSVNGAEIENLTLTGTASLNATGNALENILTGNNGANTLTGGAGNDTLDGGLGNDRLAGGLDDDVYIINAATGKTIVELAGEGIDEVRATVSYTLVAEVENLTLLGSANLNGTGNALANTLAGNAGNNTLNGLAGADVMIGNGGNDVFIVDDAGDDVTGTGTIFASVTRDLNINTTGVDNLTLTGTAAIDGTGNAAANTIMGNAAVNTLSGMGGNDTFFVDALDIVDGGAQSDTVVIGFSSSLANANWTSIENITLTGTAMLNATGDANANTLIGNSAKNTLDGGLGDDTYGITAGDVIIDAGGTDTVRAGFSYVLQAGLENIILTGTGNINATGDAGANTIIGNSGKNTLDGRGGADTLAGGLGDDTYVVTDGLATITEVAGEGIDTVRASVNYALTDEVENLVLTGAAAINGTGNTLANTITGNGGNNILDGGAGADSMAGGAGDDIFIVDDSGDVVSDTAGIDLVQSDVSFVLGLRLENLTLTGGADLSGTGNNLRNVITGNTGNNTLDGGTGVDTLIGGLGDDMYFVDSVLDVVIEHVGEGIDTVTSTVSYTLSQDVDNLILSGTTLTTIGTGNALANSITGSDAINRLYGRDGDDTINGGLGADTLYGELGNDTLSGDAGKDHLFGGDGADYFHFDATAFENVDVVRDYSLAQGDVIDVVDVLTPFYDPLTDNINDFLRLGPGGFVQVDIDGTDGDFGWVSIALLSGIQPVLNQTVVTFLVPT